MIPNSRPQIDRETVIDYLIAQGLWTNRKLSKAVVVGIRGYMMDSMGEAGENDRGIYDDAIILLTPIVYKAFNGNTDPSRFRRGIAKLTCPQKVTYRLGYHGYGRKSGHDAFRQNSAINIRRDGDTGHGTKLEDGSFTDKFTDPFWINLHKGGHSTTSSAGCQTLPPTQWHEFYKLAVSEMGHYKQEEINYYLISNPELIK